MVVYYQDQFYPDDEVKISISDRGFLFGRGVFTSLRVCDGNIECVHRHLSRLKDNCKYLNIDPPDVKVDLLLDLVERNNAHTGLWRMKIIISEDLLVTLQKVKEELYPPCHLAIYPEPIHRPL